MCGNEIKVESDNKPLEHIFRKPLHQVHMRLQKMLLRLQKYSLRVTYKPSNELHIADALSHAYLTETDEELLEEDLIVKSVFRHLPVTEEKQEGFKRVRAEDLEVQIL